MDPTDCLRLLLDALADHADGVGDGTIDQPEAHARAEQHARDLADWLAKDGYPPVVLRVAVPGEAISPDAADALGDRTATGYVVEG